MNVKYLVALFFSVGLYLGLVLASYAFFNWLDPYDPDEDCFSDGDTNKGMAFCWPITVPIYLVTMGLRGICILMDMIREYRPQKERIDNVH